MLDYAGIVEKHVEGLRRLSAEAWRILAYIAEAARGALRVAGVGEGVLENYDPFTVSSILSQASAKPDVADYVEYAVGKVWEKVRETIARAVPEPPEQMEWRSASGLFHLAYLVTGNTDARHLASILYAMHLAEDAREKLHVLAAALLTAKGEHVRATALMTLGLWNRLKVKPARREEEKIAAAIELNYLLDIASEVDGNLLQKWSKNI